MRFMTNANYFMSKIICSK